MRTRDVATNSFLALMIAVPAAAQTPVVKPNPVQNPIVVQIPPAPPVPLTPVTPMVIDMPSLDLQALNIDLQSMQIATREALDQARLAWADAKWDWDTTWIDLQDRSPIALSLNRANDAYNSGKDLLAARKYEQAITQFERVVTAKGTNADGALYWKAYAQFKLGKTDDSVATIGALRKDFPQSRYIGDARVLEADAKRRAGQPVNPAAIDDDQLKILAINGIKNTDPERAIPLLEGVLSSTNSLNVKKQALYVLASMPNQPKARQILMNYAKGAAGNPDLQIEAIKYVVAGGDKGASTVDLMQIYQGTQDTTVRLAVISALRGAAGNSVSYYYTPGGLGAVASIDAAKAEAKGKGGAATQATISTADVWSLYEKETNKEVRSALVGLLGSVGGNDQLLRVVKTDKDQDIVRRAIRSLGSQPAAKTGQLLIDLYSSEQDQQTRLTVINALGSQNNAEGLVALARKEGTLPLKKEIVKQLSDMAPRSKVAADYLMEIIK